jgi:transposase InsO family protein
LSRKKIGHAAQEELIKVVKELEELNISEACETLGLKARRYYRWLNWEEPVKKEAWNRIRPEEEAAILCAARDEKLSDMRAAGLMVYGHESKKYYCSVSTIQRVLKRNDLQPPYEIPRRKKPAKPDIRELMKEPRKVISYDATDFYLTNRLRVVVIPMLDLGSRKFIHYGIKVRSFRQEDVMKIWDEALWKEGIDASQLTALSDRGGPMKGSKTKAHLIGKWEIKLQYARPYTPDDNAWVEAFIKYLKYHPDCPEYFEAVQDVTDWVAKFQKLYNDHPHSALGYVRPNEEYAGLGNMIRQKRKDNLQAVRRERLAYYRVKKKGVSSYGLDQESAYNRIIDPCLDGQELEYGQNGKNHALEAFIGGGDIRQNSPAVLCRNR